MIERAFTQNANQAATQLLYSKNFICSDKIGKYFIVVTKLFFFNVTINFTQSTIKFFKQPRDCMRVNTKRIDFMQIAYFFIIILYIFTARIITKLLAEDAIGDITPC